MDRRRILRLASVLVASQLRAGRSTSTPNDFFGRPAAVLVADAGVFVLMFTLGVWTVGGLVHADRPLFDSLAPEVIAFLPLLALGAVLVAGLMFELSNSSRFAASDAANWMPITPVEYVAASSLAATFVYSITAALALAIGAAITWYSGALGAFAISAGLSLLGLFEGAVLIEILRSSTQRISAVVTRRTGRATVVLRLVLFLLVLLGIQVAFNPILLFGLLTQLDHLGWVAFAVPLLWPSRAVIAVGAADGLTAAVLIAAEAGLVVLLVVLAAYLRVRFWAPMSSELSLAPHRYAEQHRWLAVVGLKGVESAIVSKDLRGLARRRELLPVLVVPLVLAVVSLVSTYRSGGGGVAPVASGFLATWIAGFFALLLATTSFAQERRAIQNLYAMPIAPRSVFRAKVAGVLLPGLVFGLTFWAVVALVFGLPMESALGLLAVVVLTTLIGGFVGLTFASRYSDFQERPRPQFLRPAAMIGAMLLGIALIFGVAIPSLFWIYGPRSDWPPFAIALAIGSVIVIITFRLARSGTDRLLRSLPI